MSLLRRLFPRTYMAQRNLLRARSRSTLAVLTIVIGVVAIASLGSFGAAFETAQRDALGELGNEVLVTPGADAEGLVDDRDRRNVQGIAGDATVVPLRQTSWPVAGGDEQVTVYAVDDPTALFDVAEGSIPANWRSGTVVGADFAEAHDVAPGETVEVGGRTLRVHAVLEREGQLTLADPDEAVVVPIDAVEVDGYHGLAVIAETTTEASEVAEEIDATMNERAERVDVTDFSQFADQFDQAYEQINTFLIGVGAISLFVAGISIANVMLMSVLERREEIGVLRAVGYGRLDVLGMMLAEASLLGVAGATVGVGISLLVTLLINALLLADPTAFQPAIVRYLVLALVFGVVTSLLAGIYPAWKAAQKPPVEALRG